MMALCSALHIAAPRFSPSRLLSTVKRIGVDDPRMSKIVIHNKVIYLSGLTDTAADDGKLAN